MRCGVSTPGNAVTAAGHACLDEWQASTILRTEVTIKTVYTAARCAEGQGRKCTQLLQVIT